VWTNGMGAGIVLKASGIPARFALEDALVDLYSGDGAAKAFACSVAR
jgi:hypothetical protein